MLSVYFYTWQIFSLRCFIAIMLVSSVQYSPYNAANFRPISFAGRKVIDLSYVLKNRSHLLPERVLEKVQEIVVSKPQKMPTLKEVHEKIYAPLLECKTLEEAQKLFPEFTDIKEANISFKRITGNIRKLQESGRLEDKFSLKMLQGLWANLKSQDEIAKEMGLGGRTSLTWVLQKIGFVNYNTNYKTLLMSSDPEKRAVIAAKTTAWNALHPDLMRARNKHAAQYMKKAENRAAQSDRMKKHFEEHPERREQVSRTSKEYWSVSERRQMLSDKLKKYAKEHPEKARNSSELAKKAWATLDDIKILMSDYVRIFIEKNPKTNSAIREVLRKRKLGESLNEFETNLLKMYQKSFLEAHSEVPQRIKKAYKIVQNKK